MKYTLSSSKILFLYVRYYLGYGQLDCLVTIYLGRSVVLVYLHINCLICYR